MSLLPDESPDPVANLIEALDEAAFAGKVTTLTSLPDPDPDALSAFAAAHASLQLLNRVWPHAGSRGASDDVTIGHDDPAPATVGRFRIVRELGRGGFGIVFLAHDPALDRSVALKVPRSDLLLGDEVRRRFVREAHAAASLDHPNIVPLYEAGKVGSFCYLASAYCVGPTLATWLRMQTEPVPTPLAARLVAELAHAAHHAHERGVLHRDLKPSNVMIDGGDDVDGAAGVGKLPLVPRITDFGLARLMGNPGEEATASFAAMGSAPYMAPEQADGQKVGPAADVYSLGAILYALLCGRAPHQGRTDLETLRRVATEEIAAPRRRRREVARDLEAVCMKCLERNPARRYATARALADDLGRFLAGEPTLARPLATVERIERWSRRHPKIMMFLALVVACAGVFLTWDSGYRAQLEDVQRLAHEHEEDASRSNLAARRAQYVADIRLAVQFAQELQGPRVNELLERNRPRPGEADLREFAWYHLMRRCHMERSSLEGHTGDVYHAEFSPDGRSIASAGKDGTLRLWDAASGRPQAVIPAHGTEVNWVAFSPDGTLLATVDDDGLVKLWDAATHALRFERKAHQDEASFVLFSRDGKTLFSGGRKDGKVKVWDPSTGDERASFTAQPANLEGAALSPEGKVLVTVGSTGTNSWDLARGYRPNRWTGGQSGIQGVAFSHDGAILATVDESSGKVMLWESPQGRLLRETSRQLNGAFAVTFAHGDRMIATAGDDPTIRFWDVSTGELVDTRLGHGRKVWSLALSPDGRTLVSASADGTVKLWDYENNPIRSDFSPSPAPEQAAFSPDGRSLTFAGSHGLVSTWDVEAAALRDTDALGEAGKITRVVLNGDATSAAVVREDGVIDLWDLARRRCHGSLRAVSGNIEPPRVRFDCETRRLACVTNEGLSIWDIRSEQKIYKTVFSEMLSDMPGGGFFVRGNGGVFTWRPEVASRGESRPFPGYENDLPLAFSPDGTILATTGRYRSTTSFRLWHWPSLELRANREGHPANISRVAFSPDGRTFVSGDESGTVKFWNVDSVEELMKLEKYSGAILQISFSPDGGTLLILADTPSSTKIATLWRTTVH